MARGSSAYRREGRNAGYIGGDPEKECPYTSPLKSWARQCWIEGFNQEIKFLEEVEREKEDELLRDH